MLSPVVRALVYVCLHKLRIQKAFRTFLYVYICRQASQSDGTFLLYTICLQEIAMDVNKISQVISFRLGDSGLEALKQQQHPGESLNQTAQRLLKQSLGLSTVSTEMSTSSLSTLYTKYVDSCIAVQLTPLQEKLAQLETALGEFAA